MYNTGMKGTIAVDRTEKVGITLPKSILQRIDKVRGDIPRSTYIRRAVEVYLKQVKGR
jgi:metal-responsive CopG/Arc/MetJ family transcriptional regulator